MPNPPIPVIVNVVSYLLGSIVARNNLVAILSNKFWRRTWLDGSGGGCRYLKPILWNKYTYD